MDILFAFAVLAGLGVLFGAVLAVAGKVFAVEEDPRLEPLTEALPGANCGGCGFSGCAAYAQAVLKGEAEPGRCPVGGAEVAKAMGDILGVVVQEQERCVALVKCSGYEGHAQKKYDYDGLADCHAASRLPGGGPNECPHGCLGFGSCVKACPFGAMSVKNGVATVNHEKCVGCMVCADACPRDLIIKVPYSADITVACNSKEKGAALRKYCDIGCLGCHLCEKACEHDAIHVVDNLARIDYSKCVSCGLCAAKCPRHLIRDARLNREHDEPVPVSDSKYSDTDA